MNAKEFYEGGCYCQFNDPNHIRIKRKSYRQEFTSLAEIDEIVQQPKMDNIQLSYLEQKGFDHFIKNYAQSFKFIQFSNCSGVKDWSGLSCLTQLAFMSWQGNRRIAEFWDMSQNTALTGLCIEDFPKIKSLAGLEKANNLQALTIGNVVWNRAVIYEWHHIISDKLRYLCFGGADMGDDLTFLNEMPNLEIFDFARGVLTTEQIAWICANFPNLRGYCLKAWRVENVENRYKLYMVHGKRKPMFSTKNYDETVILQKISKYQAQFDKLVEQYKGIAYPV